MMFCISLPFLSVFCISRGTLVMLLSPDLCLAVYSIFLCNATCDKLSLYQVVAPVRIIFAFCVFFMIFQRMGAGRKTETFYAATPNTPAQTRTNAFHGTYSAAARNLPEDELGGVIFGCKHNTMEECLSKQLFG